MTIRELIEASPLPKGAEGLLEPGPLPPDEAGAILALARAKAGLMPQEKGEGKTMKRSKFGLMLLAGVVCAGAVVASAAALFQWDKGLAEALGVGEEALQGALRESGNAIQSSQTSQGWTMTISQAVGDRGCAYLLLDLAAPEGTVLDADLYQLDDCQLVFEKERRGVWGWECLKDEDKTDHRISFLVHMSMDEDMRTAQGVLKVRGVQAVRLREGEQGGDAVERLAELSYELPFRLDYQEQVKSCRPGQTVQVERGLIKGAVTVEQVEITPLSVRVRLSSPDAILKRVWPLTEGTPSPGAVLLAVQDRSGSPILPDTVSMDEGDGAVEMILSYRPVIDPAEVELLILDGVEIPLKWEGQ